MGSRFDGRCYATASDAAAAWADSMVASDGSSVVTVRAVSVSGDVATATLVRRTFDGLETSLDVSRTLNVCEHLDGSFYGPVLAAFVVALVGIKSLHIIQDSFSNREAL